MPKNIAISFKGVHQSYPLYQNPREMIMGVLGINKLLKRDGKVPIFHALKGIDLTVHTGERIGIVGQNGAGKTTLLKLITSNYFPTQGEVKVYGKVQSLMDSGVGFHQEFTGIENIRSSLVYNGLSAAQMRMAIDDIIEFSELGDFINQPIKTYSLGMISRLGFATATAINPEILIIDEVMGAGDAYFAAKSADRMKNLTKEGTTLLLVSHSSAQITQFCKQAIWLKEGKIHMQGEALEVSKAYAKFMRELDEQRLELANKKNKEKKATLNEKRIEVPQEKRQIDGPENEIENVGVDSENPSNPSMTVSSAEESHSVEFHRSQSRWNGVGGLVIENFDIVDSNGEKRFTFQTGEEIKFIMKVKAQKAGTYPCHYVMVTYTLSGQPVTVHTYEKDEVFEENQIKSIQITYPELMLGNGDFVVSLAIYKSLDLNDTSTALFYDLLDRSFEFKVINKCKNDNTLVIHPAKWEEII